MNPSPTNALLFAAALCLLTSLRAVEGTPQQTLSVPKATAPQKPASNKQAPQKRVPQMVLQAGHEGAVKTVALAPDAKHIASGGEDGTVRLWDGQSGALLAAWPTHQGDVASLQFAPRGDLLASAGNDGRVVLRDMTGAVRVTLPAYGPLCFASDGATLLAGIPNKKYPGAYMRPALWDTKTGKQKLAFDAYNYDIAAFAPDGGIVATAEHNTVDLWDTRSGKRLRTLRVDPLYTVRALAFSADGKTLACGEEIVRLFDVATGEAVRNLTANLGDVQLVAFLPDGQLLTVANDAARLWNLQTFERESTIRAPATGFGVLALSPDGKSLLDAGSGLRFLDLSTGLWRTLSQPAAQHDEPHNLYFAPDGKTLALTMGRGSGEDTRKGESTTHGEIWLWKPGNLRPHRVLSMDDDVFHALPQSGGKTLFCEADYALTRCDVESGARRSFGEWENGISTLAVSPNGALAAGAYFTRALRLFDARSGKLLHTIPTIKNSKDDFAQEGWSWLVFSPDSKTLATSGDDATVRLWSTATGRQQRVWKLPDNPGELVYAPNGRLLAAAGESGAVWLFSVQGKTTQDKTAPRALRGHKGQVACLAISPDGRAIASGGEDGTVRIWDAPSGKFRRLLKPNAGEINAVRFTPRGVLLCATSQGQLQSWDAATGRLRLTWRPLPGKANWVAWTPEGFYDAAPGATPFLRWRQDTAQGLQWLSQLPQMHRPETIARAWGF
jgi:WD40 repeat protein